MIKLCQRSPEWASVNMGTSPYSIGRWGCLLTCVSMLTDYYRKFAGKYCDPAELAKTLLFTKDGLLMWSSLKGATQFKLLHRLYKREDMAIVSSLEDPKASVVLQVQGNHWVLAVGKTWGGGYKIIDPWFGDVATTKRYKNQITGSAHFTLL